MRKRNSNETKIAGGGHSFTNDERTTGWYQLGMFFYMRIVIDGAVLGFALIKDGAEGYGCRY
jgi:hypothetical protein